MKNFSSLPEVGSLIRVNSDRLGVIVGRYERYDGDTVGRVLDENNKFLCWLSCCSGWEDV